MPILLWDGVPEQDVLGMLKLLVKMLQSWFVLFANKHYVLNAEMSGMDILLHVIMHRMKNFQNGLQEMKIYHIVQSVKLE